MKVAKRDESNLQKTLLMFRVIRSVQELVDNDNMAYLKQVFTDLSHSIF